MQDHMEKYWGLPGGRGGRGTSKSLYSAFCTLWENWPCGTEAVLVVWYLTPVIRAGDCGQSVKCNGGGGWSEDFGLAGLHMKAQCFTISLNWLALEGGIPSASPSPKISKH